MTFLMRKASYIPGRGAYRFICKGVKVEFEGACPRTAKTVIFALFCHFLCLQRGDASSFSTSGASGRGDIGTGQMHAVVSVQRDFDCNL
jgi:hypothetical protein